MPPDYLARLFQQRSQVRLIRFEEQSVPQSSKDDLSEKLWTNYTTRSDESTDIVLLKRGLLSKGESGAMRVSVAGILFCCENPEHFLPNAYIEAVRYRGKKSGFQLPDRRPKNSRSAESTDRTSNELSQEKPDGLSREDAA